MEHDMQPARIKPHAKEHTNNPVQRPNFRGHAAGDGEVTRACTVDRGSTVKLYPYDKSMPWVYLHSDDKGSYVPHTMVVCDGCL